MTDPGAEMKARAREDFEDVLPYEDREIVNFAAAFAAKEVARATEMGKETLTHTRSCPELTPGSEDDCTCGLRWRIALQTEQTMHAAWRKRAEEAESALARATQTVLCGGTAGMVDGCGKEIPILEAYRCSDCNEYFHRDCLFKHCEVSSYVTQLRANRELIAGWKADIAKAVERAEKAESALARAVEEERAICAKDVCVYCRHASNGELWSVAKREGLGLWAHTALGAMAQCDASAIHERSQVKGGGVVNEKDEPIVLEDVQFQIAKLSNDISGNLSIGGAATLDELYDTLQCLHLLATYIGQMEKGDPHGKAE